MAKRVASSNAETPRIADKVLFWLEQDRINKELIPRVIKLHELFPQHVERPGDAIALIATMTRNWWRFSVKRRMRVGIVPFVLAFILVAAACSSDPTVTPIPTDTPAPPVATVTPTATPSQPDITSSVTPQPLVTSTPRPTPTDKPTPSPTPSSTFAGKTMRMIIGFSPGGGYDFYSRIVAEHLPRFLPGSPQIIVQNMPGAGSVIAANWLFNTANPQELNIGTFSPSLYIQQLGGQAGVQFKFEDFRWLASVATVNNTCFARTDTGISNFDQLLSSSERNLAVGASPSDSIYSNLLTDELDANIQLATGYQGNADLLADIEEGAIDARCGVSWSNTKALRPDWIENDFIRPFLSLTLGDGHPDLADSVPQITEYRDRFKTEIGWRALQIAIVPDSIFRPYVAPPDTPDDAVQALREAFWSMMKDARFVRDLVNADRPVIPVAGADVERIVKDAIGDAPQEAFDLFRELT